jgi:hypothetical protein
VVAAGSPAEGQIAEAARRFWVTLIDGKDIPLYKRAG